MIPCTALVVLCVARDVESLGALKRAAVGAAWELAAGATTTEDALRQIEEASARVVVVLGGFADLVAVARERWPGLRIVSVGPNPLATVEVRSLEEVRPAIVPSA